MLRRKCSSTLTNTTVTGKNKYLIQITLVQFIQSVLNCNFKKVICLYIGRTFYLILFIIANFVYSMHIIRYINIK